MSPTLTPATAVALVAASLTVAPTGTSRAFGAVPDRPNVIFLLLDDMGYADTGAYGNRYHRTPNIDRVAAEGVRFTDAYAAAPNCSPTRASILTGRWPARSMVTQYLPGNVLPHAKLLQAQLPLGLPLEETVLAQTLSDADTQRHALASGTWARERTARNPAASTRALLLATGGRTEPCSLPTSRLRCRARRMGTT